MRYMVVAALGVGFGSGAATAQLFNNGPLATGGSAQCLPTGGAPSEVPDGNATIGWNCSHTAIVGGFQLADDFVVPPGTPWRITGFRFPLYSIGASTPNITSVWVRIRNAAPPGGVVIAGDMTTNRFDGNDFDDVYRFMTDACSTSRQIQVVRASLCATLNPGTYWVEWNATGGSAGPWAPPVTLPGQAGKPNANALQRADFGWEAVLDPGSEAPQDFAFEVEGITCYADCNEDGDVNVVDFGCFQTAFVAGDCYADCNADSNLSIADFGCFQTRFVAGCP